MTDGHETIIHELQGVAARLGGNASRGNGSSANEDMLFICRSILRRLQDSGGGDDPPVIPSMLNAQKLSLTLVPAAQQAGAIKVSGGTQDGIYVSVTQTCGLVNGRAIYLLLGLSPINTGCDDSIGAIAYDDLGEGTRWNIRAADGSVTLYYSLSDVATPDLVVSIAHADAHYSIDVGAFQPPDGTVSQVDLQFNGFNWEGTVITDSAIALAGSHVYTDDPGVEDIIIGVQDNPSVAQIKAKILTLFPSTTGMGTASSGSGNTINVVVSDETYLPVTKFDVAPDVVVISAAGQVYNGWRNASDDTAASITVALATSSDMIDYGQSVQVTDGFVVSGLGDGNDGFYFKVGTVNGRDSYARDHLANDTTLRCKWNGISQWIITSDANGIVDTNDEDVSQPWESVWESATLTHPAIQTLHPPSEDITALFVSGAGTAEANGIYTERGTLNGAFYYNLLGADDDVYNLSIVRGGSDPVTDPYFWRVRNGDGDDYYYSSQSGSDNSALYPWNATGWAADSGTAPAPTITPITAAELAAGLRASNDGATNGASYISQPFHGRQYYMGLNGGGSNNLHWDTDFNVWTDDVGAWTTDNVAFPWQGTDNGGGHTGAIFARDDVASESSWTSTP